MHLLRNFKKNQELCFLATVFPCICMRIQCTKAQQYCMAMIVPWMTLSDSIVQSYGCAGIAGLPLQQEADRRRCLFPWFRTRTLPTSLRRCLATTAPWMTFLSSVLLVRRRGDQAGLQSESSTTRRTAGPTVTVRRTEAST